MRPEQIRFKQACNLWQELKVINSAFVQELEIYCKYYNVQKLAYDKCIYTAFNLFVKICMESNQDDIGLIDFVSYAGNSINEIIDNNHLPKIKTIYNFNKKIIE